jgi:thioredoxin reductase
MRAEVATSSKVMPLLTRSSRNRRRTRESTSSSDMFACMAKQLGSFGWCRQARVMDRWDCVIVGGGAAGQQSNLSAPGIGGLLGSDGRPPAELYAAGHVELQAYPSVEVRDGEVVAGARDGDDFELTLEVRDQPLAVLAAAGVSVDERPVAELRSADGELTAIVFADGSALPRRGLLVATTLHQRSTLAEQLGADAADPGPVAADAVRVDPFTRTTAPGVFTAGDISAQMPQVAAGSLAAAAVMQSLMASELERFGPFIGGDSRVGTR